MVEEEQPIQGSLQEEKPMQGFELTCPSCGFQWYAYDPMRPMARIQTCPRCKYRFNLRRPDDRSSGPRLWVPR